MALQPDVQAFQLIGQLLAHVCTAKTHNTSNTLASTDAASWAASPCTPRSKSTCSTNHNLSITDSRYSSDRLHGIRTCTNYGRPVAICWPSRPLCFALDVYNFLFGPGNESPIAMNVVLVLVLVVGEVVVIRFSIP